MSLPVYQQIMIKSTSPEEVTALLDPDINLRHPVVLNIKSMDMEEQKEIIKLIENFFVPSVLVTNSYSDTSRLNK